MRAILKISQLTAHCKITVKELRDAARDKTSCHDLPETVYFRYSRALDYVSTSFPPRANATFFVLNNRTQVWPTRLGMNERDGPTNRHDVLTSQHTQVYTAMSSPSRESQLLIIHICIIAKKKSVYNMPTKRGKQRRSWINKAPYFDVLTRSAKMYVDARRAVYARRRRGFIYTSAHYLTYENERSPR